MLNSKGVLRAQASVAAIVLAGFVPIFGTAYAQSTDSAAVANESDQAPKVQADGDPQSGSAATTAPDIVVTGTSIRGVAPVGSNLVSVGRDDIEATNAQTAQQILKTVPAVTGLGSPGQGGFGSSDGSGANAPTIHGLGASASNSTLILIDGHRLPLTGINHTVGDPNLVPSIAIERVEVLPDGASSIYGSDAVAGVINFITRKHYNGFEASGQIGLADHYATYNGNLLWGKGWGDGSALIAYSYSNRTALRGRDRPYTWADHTDQGGTNFDSFQCGPATIQPTGTNDIYNYPYNGAPITNSQNNAMCDSSQVADLLPSETRNSVFARIQQDVSDKLSFNADLTYSDRRDHAAISRGGVNATIFGPGSGKGDQINPFFVAPDGTDATSETVRFNADNLLGPGAYTDSGARTFMADAELDYAFSDNYHFTLGGTFGSDDSRQQSVGALCSSCAYLAINGTTNGSGSLTTPSIPGTSTIITNLPLTPENALDVFDPYASNLTSAGVIGDLTDSTSTALAHQTIADVRAKFDGDLFNLPGGALRFALGAEYTRYTLHQDITRPNNTGPATNGSSTLNLDYNRDVKSAYAEVLVPLVGADMGVPLMESLQLDLSGRYDHYSDFGSTTNPKAALDWVVTHGLKLRANYAESFVAPSLTSIGSGGGITGESGYSQFGQGVVTIPVDRFPGVIGLPGCPAGSTECQVGSSTVTGLLINGGNADLKPQTGQTWSVGADFTPAFVHGLHMSVTYWTNKLKGGVTSPTSALAINSPSLNYLFNFYPGGATQAQIQQAVGDLPQTGAIPGTTYFIYDFRQQNVLNLNISGIDADASYRFTAGFGSVNVGGSWSHFLKFDQQVGAGSPTFTVLNTVGFNTTFPSIQDQGRFNVGVDAGNFSVEAFVNYTGGFRNYGGSTVTPVDRDAGGYPTGHGGDKVRSYTTVDLHVGYRLPPFIAGHDDARPQLYIDVNNLLDQEPPFYNSAAGYTSFSGNPIGRIVSLGFRAPI
ncbi:TonB-dependent receptor [Sphingomonas koreensis]|nr:TonB-dependent receptor [Sphingomonas koreensis]